MGTSINYFASPDTERKRITPGTSQNRVKYVSSSNKKSIYDKQMPKKQFVSSKYN